MKPNFIVIKLCDNDFGQELEKAALQVEAAFDNAPILVSETRVIKSVMIDLVLAFSNLIEAAKGFSVEGSATRYYLEHNLEVTFHDRLPQLPDHDGGSVAIDRTRGYVWRF